jgi:hypothetical protein
VGADGGSRAKCNGGARPGLFIFFFYILRLLPKFIFGHSRAKPDS